MRTNTHSRDTWLPPICRWNSMRRKLERKKSKRSNDANEPSSARLELSRSSSKRSAASDMAEAVSDDAETARMPLTPVVKRVRKTSSTPAVDADAADVLIAVYCKAQGWPRYRPPRRAQAPSPLDAICSFTEVHSSAKEDRLIKSCAFEAASPMAALAFLCESRDYSRPNGV